MIKLKRVLICCIGTLCVVMFLLPLFAISMQNVLERQKTNTYPTQNEAAVSGYDLANATDKGGGMYKLSNEAYKNTNFVINNLKGLIKFAGLINCDDRNFKGKTVWLNADIDCQGKDVTIGHHDDRYMPYDRKFKGDFEGLNHTIYNYKFGSMTTGKRGDFYKDGNNYYYGLFTYLEGTISNLRVQNGTFIGNSGEVIGGLVGFMTPDAKIIECCVENWVVENADNRPWSAKCGIVGGYSTPTTSSNTYVGGAEIVSCYVNVEGLDYSVGPYHFKKGVLPFYRGIKIDNCVIKKQGNSGWMNTNLFDPSVYNANNMQTKGTHADYHVNSLGGDKSSSTWYYGGDDYNDGFMYLRAFITWGRLRFTTIEPKIFTNIEIADETEKDYILIPREWEKPAKQRGENYNMF